MTTQLPLSALAVPASTDFLARHVAALAEEARRRAVPVDTLPSIIEGIAAVAATGPFDPNATIGWDSGRGRALERFTLLDNVLALTSPHLRRDTLEPWPTKLEDFGPHLFPQHHSPIFNGRMDSEYLAALLIAAGANPWLLDNKPNPNLPDSVLSTRRTC